MNKIYFLGMPGCGKSTIGKKVARLMKYSFIDLDKYIEEKENCSIHDLFNYQGEEYFRKAESNYLKQLSLEEKKTVISLGGGTPCFFDNMEIVLTSGLAIYIHANEKLLLNRLKNAKSQRPLFWGLTEKEIEAKLQQMISVRKPFYERAQLTIDAVNMNENEIATQIRNYQAS